MGSAVQNGVSNMQRFYHLTDRESVPLILKNGLQPQIGKNSQIVQESKSYVYLCDAQSIPYWSILLGKNTVLQVCIPDEYLFDTYTYDGYSEIVLWRTISPQFISRAEMTLKTEPAMQHLCVSHLTLISSFCADCARYYSVSFCEGLYHTAEFFDSIRHDGEVVLNALRRLDYGVVDTQVLEYELRQLGEDGEYTLCDTYFGEDKRLWEKLPEYETDALTDVRSIIHGLLKTTLAGCLYTNTGGFC